MNPRVAEFQASTYDCPRYRELYAGWRFVDCSMLKLLHQQNGRGARAAEAPEVLIVNGPEIPGAEVSLGK